VIEGQLAVLEALDSFDNCGGQNFDDYVVDTIKKHIFRCIRSISVNHPHLNATHFNGSDDPTYAEVEQNDEIRHIDETIKNNKVVGINVERDVEELKAIYRDKEEREKRAVLNGYEKPDIYGIDYLRKKHESRIKEDESEGKKRNL
jgi:hypothetical protein